MSRNSRPGICRAVSRDERAAGRLSTGELDGKRFAEHARVAHGTIKRWLHEGMPAIQDGTRVWIEPVAADAWIAKRFNGRKTVAFDRHSYVYLAQAENEQIKIGWSSDVMRRLSELRKYRRQAVHLLACFPGNKPDELALHDRFASLSVGDEWYEDTDGSIAAYVATLGRAA